MNRDLLSVLFRSVPFVSFRLATVTYTQNIYFARQAHYLAVFVPLLFLVIFVPYEILSETLAQGLKEFFKAYPVTLKGPAQLFLNPVEVESITVKEAEFLNANEVFTLVKDEAKMLCRIFAKTNTMKFFIKFLYDYIIA